MIAGVLDWLSSPEQKLAEQRAAVSGDLAYQRAQLTADLRKVGTELVFTAAVAALVVVGVSLGARHLAQRGRR